MLSIAPCLIENNWDLSLTGNKFPGPNQEVTNFSTD
jgi:hypothetical protein